MHGDMGTASTEKSTRKGLHRFFHTSKADKYVGAALAIAFCVLTALKIFGARDWLPSLSAVDALQLALLFGIFAIVADIHYRKYEAHYDK